MIKKLAIEILVFLFVVLFVYAALNKVLEFQKFTVQIGQSPLLTGFGGFVPGLVIGVEFIVVVLLLVPRLRLVGFFAAFSLMTMFTAYIGAILTYSPYVPCSCGGVLEKFSWTEHLIFNSGFVVLGLAGIVLQAGQDWEQEFNESITRLEK
ncbi:MAG: MauE/DoxX family redox-associated membrane protein [Cyclobacteriaceae bacterium]